MTPNPEIIAPEESIQEVARKMEKNNCEILPVGVNKKLQGIITDRDLAIRVITNNDGKDNHNIGYYMTREVFSCHENDNLSKAIDIMREKNVRRLVVLNNEEQITGILSFSDILKKDLRTKKMAEVIDKKKVIN